MVVAGVEEAMERRRRKTGHPSRRTQTEELLADRAARNPAPSIWTSSSTLTNPDGANCTCVVPRSDTDTNAARVIHICKRAHTLAVQWLPSVCVLLLDIRARSCVDCLDPLCVLPYHLAKLNVYF